MTALGRSDIRKAGSSAMAGAMGEQAALAAIVLWNFGHFDTSEIGKLLDVKEDAICRTLHAARDIVKGRV